MEKRLCPYWHYAGWRLNWRVDETYLKVKGKWTYLYRTVYSQGDTIDFYLSPKRNAKAAKRFLGKVLGGCKDGETPDSINTDEAVSYGVVIDEMWLWEPIKLRDRFFLFKYGIKYG